MRASCENAKLCCNYMQMAVLYIVSPLFDLFWVAVKTYLPPSSSGYFVPLLFLVVYLPSTCFNLVEPVSLLPTVIVYSLWPVRSDTIGGAAIPGPVQQCARCSGVDYIPRLSRSLIVEGNRAVNTHHHHQPLAAALARTFLVANHSYQHILIYAVVYHPMLKYLLIKRTLVSIMGIPSSCYETHVAHMIPLPLDT